MLALRILYAKIGEQDAGPNDEERGQPHAARRPSLARSSSSVSSAFDNKPMTTPPSDMLPELAEWNNGKGIDLESWVACSGNFRLAVGYSAIFWPRFVLFEDYILREGFSIESLRGFEKNPSRGKLSVEAVMNHLHLDGIQYQGCEDITEQRIVYLGHILKEIYTAKLAWQFPDRPCEVSFYEPEDRTDLTGYEITFWQEKHVEHGAGAEWRPRHAARQFGGHRGAAIGELVVRRQHYAVEHSVYLCGWSQSPEGFSLWTTTEPRVRAEAPTYLLAKDACSKQFASAVVRCRRFCSLSLRYPNLEVSVHCD